MTSTIVYRKVYLLHSLSEPVARYARVALMDGRLGGITSETREVFDDRSNELIVSAASAWEIAMKYRIGRIALPSTPEEYIGSHMKQQSIRGLEITLQHAAATAELPLYHGDPFDRLLIAQARCEALTFVTADHAITP